ncbi:hypothetical protein CGRA01v4_09598 [Colletotrichum graminicola]|nr:hypothetical protein CGRA01v4_09598 [Colletotrichum graminicola]
MLNIGGGSTSDMSPSRATCRLAIGIKGFVFRCCKLQPLRARLSLTG